MKRIALLAGLLAAALATGCGDDCEEGFQAAEVQNVCTTGTFATGQPFTLDAQVDPSGPCEGLRCAARREGGAIFLTVEHDACAAETEESCAGGGVVTCEIPALDEGGYSLRVNGEPFGMVQAAEGGATSCAF